MMEPPRYVKKFYNFWLNSLIFSCSRFTSNHLYALCTYVAGNVSMFESADLHQPTYSAQKLTLKLT